MVLSSSSSLLCFLLILSILNSLVDCTIYFPAQKKSFAIYQWSAADVTFKPNENLTLSRNESFLSSHNTSCLVLLGQIDHVATRNYIVTLPNDTHCIIIQIAGVNSDLDRWILPTTTLTVPYPVGVLFAATSTFFTSAPDPLPFVFISWDYNYYASSYWYRVPFYIILFFLNFGCMIWGIFRLIQIFLHAEILLNVSTVCIALETLSCVFRLMVIIMKFIYYGLPWYDVNTHLDKMFNYMGFPFTLSSGIFLIFFWLDITSESLYHGAFLDVMFWPSIVLCAISFILVYVAALLSVTYVNVDFVNYLGIAMSVLIAIIALLYYFAAYKVYKYIKDREDKRSGLMKITYKILAGGTLTILVSVFSFATITATNLNETVVFQLLIILVFVSRSFLLIEIFKTPKAEVRSSTQTPEEHSNSANTKSGGELSSL